MTPYPVLALNGDHYFQTPTGFARAVRVDGVLVYAQAGMVADERPREPGAGELVARLVKEGKLK
jgi:hypothetical protein